MSKRNLVLLVLFGVMVLLLQLRPNADVDVFWRVKTGQLAIEQGELVRTDPFTSTQAGAPIPPLSWLSEIIYAALYRLGSWRLLSQANALVFAGALALAAWALPRRETSMPATVAAVVLGFMVAVPHCQIRSQNFALFFFAAVLLIARSPLRPWWKLGLAAIVMVVWQNVHPSLSIGGLALAAIAAATWLRWLFDRRAEKPWMPTALVVLAAACTLATPMGAAIFATSAENTRLARALGISEWLPVWHPAVWRAATSTWVALLISAVLLLRVRRSVRLEEIALLLAMTAVSLPMYRFSLFFAVAMIPIWSRWIALVWPAGVDVEAARVRPLLAAGAVTAVLAAAMLLPARLGTPLFDREIPLAAATRLRELGVRGVIYNYREWGGPLIFVGDGDWQVTIDGRLYLFPPSEWRRYREIALGRVPVGQVEQWYRPNAFFLRPSYHHRFIALLQQSDDWHEAYADESAVVFTRQ